MRGKEAERFPVFAQRYQYSVEVPEVVVVAVWFNPAVE
jgi:hypothetical protein